MEEKQRLGSSETTSESKELTDYGRWLKENDRDGNMAAIFRAEGFVETTDDFELFTFANIGQLRGVLKEGGISSELTSKFVRKVEKAGSM